MDYILGEAIFFPKKRVIEKDIEIKLMEKGSDRITYFYSPTSYDSPKKIKVVLKYIVKLFIFLVISWSIVGTFIFSKKTINISYQLLYSFGYILLINFYNKLKIETCCFKNDKHYKTKIICSICCSLFLTIISMVLFNLNYKIVPYYDVCYGKSKQCNAGMSIIMFFDYFYSYLILFMLMIIFHKTMSECKRLSLNTKVFVCGIITNTSSDKNLLIIMEKITTTRSIINKNITDMNSLYILLKLIGLICLYTSVIEIYNKELNVIDICDMMILLTIEIIYLYIINQIYSLNENITELIDSPATVNKIGNEISLDMWNLLNTLANKKIRSFQLCGTNIAENSIVQQTIITVFSWIIAQKIVDLIG